MKVLLAATALLGTLGVAPAAADHSGGVTAIRDVAGDANHINDGGEFENGDVVTPVSDPALDVLDVTVAPMRNGATTVGFTVAIDTLAPLRDRAQLTFKTRTRNCADIIVQYVQGPASEGALLSSGCSSTAVRIRATGQGARLVLAVPFSAMPDKSRKDKLLQTLNVFTQVHATSEPAPLRGRPIGLTSIDTTLAKKTYRLR